MFRKFSFWIWGTIIFQWFTAALHSTAVFIAPKPEITDEKEKLLVDLAANFKKDYGAGFVRSYDDFVFAVSLSFTIFFLFSGFVNWWLNKKKISGEVWRGLLLIQVITFGIVFITMLLFTFLPPIVCTGFIFLFSIGAYISSRKRV